MHLTGGQYKGRKMGDFSGKKFLDLFLGSGIMTLEALSRGFETLSFEIDSSVINIAKQNLKDLSTDTKIIKSDSLKYNFKKDSKFDVIYKKDSKFDVIYADPPWDYSYGRIFEICQNLLLHDGVAIIECDKKKKPDVIRELGKFTLSELFKEKNYGRCCLLFIRLCR